MSTPRCPTLPPATLLCDCAPQRDSRKRKLDEEKMAFGTYSGDLGTTLTYRVKKPGAYGGYKIVTEVGAVVIEGFHPAFARMR